MVMDDAEGVKEAIVDHGHAWSSPSRPTVAFGTNTLSEQIEGAKLRSVRDRYSAGNRQAGTNAGTGGHRQ